VWTDKTSGVTYAVGDNNTLERYDLAGSCKVNNVKDGVETDVDCGNYCAPCGNGKACVIGTDCASLVCAFNACQAPTCSDGVRNQGESDVDCGISACLCPAGKICQTNANCSSGACSNGLCLSACQNGVKDGMETDIDCGGPTCPKCGYNKSCVGGTDCLSGTCTASKCTMVPVHYNVLAQKMVTYQGINYVLLQVSFSSTTSLTATWCDEYEALCSNYGATPTGCGMTFTSMNGSGYQTCRTMYNSNGVSDTLGCNPSGGVSGAAQAAGYADASTSNSFAFHYCDANSCSKTMCSGANCDSSLSYCDSTQAHCYTLCKL
jgi:hypothetical protein